MASRVSGEVLARLRSLTLFVATEAERRTLARASGPEQRIVLFEVEIPDKPRAAVGSLREQDRELIRLTEWEQMPVGEAGAVVGLRPGTARMRLLRARRALESHPALRRLVDPTQSTEPQSTEPQSTEPQSTEPQSTGVLRAGVAR